RARQRDAHGPARGVPQPRPRQDDRRDQRREHGRLPRLDRTAAASTERRKPVTVTTEPPRTPAAPAPAPRHNTGILRWLTSTDHKVIGLSYLVTSFGFFCIGGLLALGMRTQLAQPGLSVLSPETYNEFFTMHGSIMMYLFAVPFAFG